MKRQSLFLAAAFALLLTGCNSNNPQNTTNEPGVNYTEEIVFNNPEYISSYYNSNGAISVGDTNDKYSATLCFKMPEFTDGTYSAKCKIGESTVWGFLYPAADYGSYDIDSISATIKNYPEEGRIEITAKYYNTTKDTLYILHFGQEIETEKSEVVEVSGASFIDDIAKNHMVTITNGSLVSDGDFYFYITYYTTDKVEGSYSFDQLVLDYTSIGVVESLEAGTLTENVELAYGSLNVECINPSDSTYKAVFKATASNKVSYTITVTGKLTETGYSIDAKEDIEYDFSSPITVATYSIADYEGQYGNCKYATIGVQDLSKHLQFIAFFNGDVDSVTVVPEGTYYINSYFAAGTVAAGIYKSDENNVYNSYFVGVKTPGTLTFTSPYYVLVEGTVTIKNDNGKCSIEVNALNSKQFQAHIYYTGKLIKVADTSTDSTDNTDNTDNTGNSDNTDNTGNSDNTTTASTAPKRAILR